MGFYNSRLGGLGFDFAVYDTLESLDHRPDHMGSASAQQQALKPPLSA